MRASIYLTICIIVLFTSSLSFSQTVPTEIQWQRSFGGSEEDELTSMVPTLDGGYVLGGYSNSGATGNKESGGFGEHDYWVVKVNDRGEHQWERVFGGSFDDRLTGLQHTTDGGYALAGWSGSGVSGNKRAPNLGDAPGLSDDFWVIKLDSQGDRQWEQTYGGLGGDHLDVILEIPGDGFILGGSSGSDSVRNRTKKSPSFGGGDYWLVKIDSAGGVEWEETYGGTEKEHGVRLQCTAAGGFIVGGHTASGVSGNKTSPAIGRDDFWIFEVDRDGVKLWELVLGGIHDDVLGDIHITPDGGLIAGGWSDSPVPGGNKTSPNALRDEYNLSRDFWVVKLAAGGVRLSIASTDLGARITWPAVAEVEYVLESAPGPYGPWENHVGQFEVVEGRAVAEVRIGTNTRFFRVRMDGQ